jgi:hypothetical protein
MKKLLVFMALALALALTGCIPSSIHPFYTENDLVFDPNLIGSWGDADTETTFIERADSLVYKISLEDKSGRAAFEGHLFKINGVLFLELFPDADELKINETYKQHLIPVHSLYRIEQTEPDLILNAIDYNWLMKLNEMDDQTSPVDFLEIEGRLFLSSPTEKLQAFIAANLDTPGAFTTEPMILHRIKR